MQIIIKERKRNHIFRYMTKYVRKREWGSLNRLYIKNDNNIIVEIYITRKNTEKVIIEYNANHFKKYKT